jgi:hypothetical protein
LLSPMMRRAQLAVRYSFSVEKYWGWTSLNKACLPLPTSLTTMELEILLEHLNWINLAAGPMWVLLTLLMLVAIYRL